MYEVLSRSAIVVYSKVFSDWIYNIDYTRISGTEPSSVIFSQTK